MDKFYELAFLISPLLDQKQAEALIQEIKELILQKGGKIEAEMPGVKRKLGYPVLKFSEAILAGFDFFNSEATAPEIKNEIRLKKDILRYILFQKQKKVFIPRKKSSSSQAKSKPKKVELKDLDKKLEEILK